MKSKKGTYGEKMIELRVKFWTNDIAPKSGDVLPKHCWDSGMIVFERNHLHEIANKKNQPFHSLPDLIGKIEKMLISHGVTLHHGNRSRKTFSK